MTDRVEILRIWNGPENISATALVEQVHSFDDPVHLLGYGFDGKVVDGAVWPESEYCEFFGHNFRRMIKNPAYGNFSQAVCYGTA